MKVRCSLVISSERPFVVRKGNKTRWTIRMKCGAMFESASLEPPVSVLCAHSEGCTQGAPSAPRKVRPPLEW